jgi:hypothetical protein
LTQFRPGCRIGGCANLGSMAKPTYRIVPQKRGLACDVEVTEPGASPRIINTFNTEAEAWDWLNEKLRIDKLAARRAKALKNKH